MECGLTQNTWKGNSWVLICRPTFYFATSVWYSHKLLFKSFYWIVLIIDFLFQGGMSLSTSTGSLSNGTTPVGTFAEPRKRPSDAALDAVMMKKVRTRESADGTRNLEVRPTSNPSPSWCRSCCQRILEIYPTWSFHKILSGLFPIYLCYSLIFFSFFKF